MSTESHAEIIRIRRQRVADAHRTIRRLEAELREWEDHRRECVMALAEAEAAGNWVKQAMEGL